MIILITICTLLLKFLDMIEVEKFKKYKATFCGKQTFPEVALI